MAPPKGFVPWNKGKKKTFERTCLICSKVFQGRRYSKFCSRTCSAKNPKNYKPIQCRGCGVTFIPISNRHWTCSSCSESKSLQTRVYRYGAPGTVIKKLLEERGGLCVLCDRPAKCIDHDHETNVVRGALCYGCNNAMGRLDTEGWLEAAIHYKERGKRESPETR